MMIGPDYHMTDIPSRHHTLRSVLLSINHSYFDKIVGNTVIKRAIGFIRLDEDRV
jgi:hypothetical protein